MIDPKILIYVMKAKKAFLRLALSAITPIIGDEIATIIAVSETALDQRAVPIISFSAIALVKYVA